MVRYECMIHQRVNYVLDHLHFRRNSLSMRTIPKPDNSTENKQTMSKANNYNKYNYDQESGGKHMGRKQYTIRGLVMRFGSEV